LGKYEAVFILDEKKLDDHGDAFIRDVAKVIKGLGGQVHEKNSMGRKQFARPIRNMRAGSYWGLIFDLDPAQLRTFQDTYRHEEVVLRLEVFRYEPPPPQPPRT